MDSPYLRVLGSTDWNPSKHNDNSCYTLCDKVLVDANSALVMNLINQDLDPIAMDTVFFTHMHADHYMGLGPLLHLWRVRRGDLGDLTLVGPRATVRDSVELALRYAFHDSRDMMAEIKRKPRIMELSGHGQYADHPDFSVEYMDSDHAVPGLCYRFTHKASGRTVGLSGDTRYQAQYAQLFSQVDLLVYECSYGAGPLDDFNEVCRHSSAREAAQVAAECQAKRLLLTHCYLSKREAALTQAQRSLTIPVAWAMPEECFPF